MRWTGLVVPLAGILLAGIALQPVAAQTAACSRDAVQEQVIGLASQASDPASLLADWLRLSRNAEAAGMPVPLTWEAFCTGVLAAWTTARRDGPAPLDRAPVPAAIAVPVRVGAFSVEAHADTPSTITLSWPSQAGAEAYDVRVFSEAGVAAGGRRVYPTGTGRAGQVRATVGGLLPGTTYRLEVSALAAAGNQSLVEIGRSYSVVQTPPRQPAPTPTSFIPTPLPTLALPSNN